MDSEEITFWAAWEAVCGPLGPERFDYLAGTIAASNANLWRQKGEQLGRMDLIDDWGGLRAKAEAEAEGAKRPGRRPDAHGGMEDWGRRHGLIGG